VVLGLDKLCRLTVDLEPDIVELLDRNLQLGRLGDSLKTGEQGVAALKKVASRRSAGFVRAGWLHPWLWPLLK
jgi:hypothetical protein